MSQDRDLTGGVVLPCSTPSLEGHGGFSRRMQVGTHQMNILARYSVILRTPTSLGQLDLRSGRGKGLIIQTVPNLHNRMRVLVSLYTSRKEKNREIEKERDRQDGKGDRQRRGKERLRDEGEKEKRQWRETDTRGRERRGRERETDSW